MAQVKVTKNQIWQWAHRGLVQGQRYMLLCFDDFSYEGYTIYVTERKRDTLKAEIRKRDGRNMQRVMEVYDLTDPKLEQNVLKSRNRIWQVPK